MEMVQQIELTVIGKCSYSRQSPSWSKLLDYRTNACGACIRPLTAVVRHRRLHSRGYDPKPRRLERTYHRLGIATVSRCKKAAPDQCPVDKSFHCRRMVAYSGSRRNASKPSNYQGRTKRVDRMATVCSNQNKDLKWKCKSIKNTTEINLRKLHCPFS